ASPAMSLLEVCCQGAHLDRLVACPAPGSLLAEVVLDGAVLGRTGRCPRGDRRPRWEDRFLVPGAGRVLAFRVVVVSAVQEIFLEICLGIGRVDLQALLLLYSSMEGEGLEGAPPSKGSKRKKP
ncbi:unnamed protein product, partial [Prorocentrum cordatum]